MSAMGQEQVGDAELEALLEKAQGMKEGGSAPASVVRPAIAKISYSHAAMIDLIVANPGISQNALAERFGYTPSWISQIICSDTFQSALAKRREEMVDPIVALSVEQGFKAIVSRAVDVLQQKLDRPAKEIPDNLALRALEIGSRAAGYGAKDHSPTAPATPAEVHIHLEQLGGGLVALLQRKKREAELVDVSPGRQDADGALSPPAAQIAALTDNTSEEH